MHTDAQLLLRSNTFTPHSNTYNVLYMIFCGKKMMLKTIFFLEIYFWWLHFLDLPVFLSVAGKLFSVKENNLINSLQLGGGGSIMPTNMWNNLFWMCPPFFSICLLCFKPNSYHLFWFPPHVLQKFPGPPFVLPDIFNSIFHSIYF